LAETSASSNPSIGAHMLARRPRRIRPGMAFAPERSTRARYTMLAEGPRRRPSVA
jgi:hypothetical protein